MLAKRIIPCLDVDGGRVVKGIRFVDLIDAGDPVEQARRYDREGADELVFLDITASSDKRDIVAGMVRRVADSVFIPFTVGGGIRTVEDMRAILTWIRDIGANAHQPLFIGKQQLQQAETFYNSQYRDHLGVYTTFEVIWLEAKKSQHNATNE